MQSPPRAGRLCQRVQQRIRRWQPRRRFRKIARRQRGVQPPRACPFASAPGRLATPEALQATTTHILRPAGCTAALVAALWPPVRRSERRDGNRRCARPWQMQHFAEPSVALRARRVLPLCNRGEDRLLLVFSGCLAAATRGVAPVQLFSATDLNNLSTVAADDALSLAQLVLQKGSESCATPDLPRKYAVPSCASSGRPKRAHARKPPQHTTT